MSIINEALKKTEQYIQENEAKNKPRGNGLASNSQSHKPQGNGLASFGQSHSQNHNPPAKIIPAPKLLLIYILILLTGILLSKFIFGLLSQSHKPQGNGLASNSQSHKPQGDGLASFGQSHKPQGNGLASFGQSHKVPEPNFVLNGIFFSDNDSYALVNNQIVRGTDSVDGAKVAKITANTVELESDGKLIGLSIRR